MAEDKTEQEIKIAADAVFKRSDNGTFILICLMTLIGLCVYIGGGIIKHKMSIELCKDIPEKCNLSRW